MALCADKSINTWFALLRPVRSLNVGLIEVEIYIEPLEQKIN